MAHKPLIYAIISAVALGLLTSFTICALRPADPVVRPLPKHMQADDTVMPVILLLGQSNMVGRAQVLDHDRLPVGGVFMWRPDLDPKSGWMPASQPLFADGSYSLGIDAARQYLYQAYMLDVPVNKVGLVPLAVGGSSVTEWLPGSRHMRATERAIEACQRGKRTRIAGIIWYQGEADRAMSSDQYSRAFKRVLNALPDVPVVAVAVQDANHINLAIKENVQILIEEHPTWKYFDRVHVDRRTAQSIGFKVGNMMCGLDFPDAFRDYIRSR